MGDPFTIGALAAGAAASAGSIAAKRRAVKKAENKAAKAQAAESQRQRQIQEKATKEAAESLKEFEPESFKEKEDVIVGRQMGQVADLLQKQKMPQTFKASSAPEVIVRASDRAKKTGKKTASEFGENLAKFGAQGGALQLANLRAGQGARRVDRLGRDARISAMLAADEIARARGDTDTLLGEVLGGVGRLGLSAGLSGAASQLASTPAGVTPTNSVPATAPAMRTLPKSTSPVPTLRDTLNPMNDPSYIYNRGALPGAFPITTGNTGYFYG